MYGLIGDIIAGILAFIGAYLGTKRIKRYLIDDYIENRVSKTQNVNDQVLSKARNILSSFEQTYTDTGPINENDLAHLISLCRELSRLSEDGGKEVSTICYYLYETVKNLEPKYEDEDRTRFESLTIGEVVNFISNSLRLVIFFCTNSAPIPFKTRLKKKSTIKRSLRKYLNDKKFYSLRHQPFGLTFNANSEVALRYSDILAKTNSYIFERNFYMLLQGNIPILYRMIVNKIYAPLIINKETDDSLLGSHRLHLIKFRIRKSYGSKPGEFVEFYYSNLNSILIFIKNYNLEKIRKGFKDLFLNKDWNFDKSYQLEKRLNETLVMKVDLEKAKNNYKQNRWKIKWNLFKHKRADKN